MAKVIFMAGIASISGKLGDVVFRKSASGKTYMAKALNEQFVNPQNKKSITSSNLAQSVNWSMQSCPILRSVLLTSNYNVIRRVLKK